MNSFVSSFLTGLSLTALAVVMPAAAAMAEDNDSNLRWDTTKHDFGTFNEDLGTVHHTFLGINRGQDTISISTLRASCGCTTPTVDKKIIPPGDTVRLKVSYDPYNRPGPFSKKITVLAQPHAYSTLNIEGTVISSTRRLLAAFPHEVGTAYRVNSSDVALGAVCEDRTVSAKILGVNNTEQPVTPVVTRIPRWMNAIVEPTPVEPGKSFAISITANCPEIGLLGLTRDTVVIASVEHPDMSLTLPASIILYEDIPYPTEEEMQTMGYLEAEIRTMDFGDDIDPKSDKPIKRTLVVSNPGNTPIIIRRAYTLEPGFSIKAPEKLAPGEEGTVEVTLIPSKLRPGTTGIDARLQMIANSPLNTNIDLTALGKVSQ